VDLFCDVIAPPFTQPPKYPCTRPTTDRHLINVELHFIDTDRPSLTIFERKK